MTSTATIATDRPILAIGDRVRVTQTVEGRAVSHVSTVVEIPATYWTGKWGGLIVDDGVCRAGFIATRGKGIVSFEVVS